MAEELSFSVRDAFELKEIVAEAVEIIKHADLELGHKNTAPKKKHKKRKTW